MNYFIVTFLYCELLPTLVPLNHIQQLDTQKWVVCECHLTESVQAPGSNSLLGKPLPTLYSDVVCELFLRNQ